VLGLHSSKLENKGIFHKMDSMDKRASSARILTGYIEFDSRKENNFEKRSSSGDPISSYLFIIAMDFLPMWIKKLNEMQILKPPFQGCRSCLLYADDTLLMLRPEDNQLRILKVILHIFEKLSGLRVNLAKSELIVTNASENQVAQLA
jgi:Reverse transcriptase (RNA-dependent DNA polymerase)